MKHLSKIVLFIALIGLLPTGCVTDIIMEEVTTNPDYIGFSSTTTRATVADIATLISDGFNVYATGGSTPQGWYSDGANLIDGTNTYKYIANQWAFIRPVKWATDPYGYPMNFYAHYPTSPTGLTVSYDFSSGVAIEGHYTVPGVGNQVDLLAASATAKTKPATGYLTLPFNHILSKVNFGIIAGQGTMPVIQSLQLVNIKDTRTYDFIAGDWDSSPSALSGNAAYYYYGAPDGTDIDTFMPNYTDESTSNPFYQSGHSKHLMLMPQTAASWSPQREVAPDATSGGYISVTYRMSTGLKTNGNGDLREVGLLDATEHPDYNALGGGLTGPLYVKAGFPLPATSGLFTLEKGKSHVYNIVLGAHGSSNGYILDDYYYDEKGVRTGLRLIEVLKEGKKIGDKLQDGIIHVILDVDYWDNQDGGDLSPGTIKVTPRNIMLSYNAQTPATQSLTVNSLKANGSPNPAAQWTLSVPDTQDWLRISFDQNASFATAYKTLPSSLSPSSSASHTVYIYTTENTTDALREAEFFLDGEKAGNIYQTFNFNILPGINSNPTGFYTYTGAFWRTNETGERIISIPAGTVNGNDGGWTASVAWMDPRWNHGDIVLSTEKLPGMQGADPQIYKATPGNAEDYQVVSDHMIVKGNVTVSNKNIVFRIGLKSKYTPVPGHPVRYAKVVISYANNSKHQIIYLRQGEEADYLFRDNDLATTDKLTWARTATRRFAPYNLTADIFDKAADVQGANPPVNPGKFTKFPTQAGAFFQWANLYSGTNVDWIRTRWAWNPYIKDIPKSPAPEAVRWYETNPSSTIYWTSIEAENETCPPGYRRPHDGSITTSVTGNDISNSELRQSLFLNPQTGFNYSSDLSNCMLGYYADGFFDRREITTEGRTVAAGTGEIAHIGRLFYNPLTDSDHYGASIFLPHGGFRNNTDGELRTDLIAGTSYWTASTTGSSGNAVSLRMMETHAGPWIGPKPFGYLIRCVKK